MPVTFPPPSICTITNGTAGMVAQTIGLAVCFFDGKATITQRIVTAPAIARLLPAPLNAHLCRVIPPVDSAIPPTIIINCGTDGQALTLKMKKQYGAFAVCIQRPAANEHVFDAIVAPRHDYSATEIRTIEQTPNAKEILTLGAIGKIDATKVLANREQARQRFAKYKPPFVAALIGGDNRAYRQDIQRTVTQLSNIAQKSAATLLITPSRRSKPAFVNALSATFMEAHYIWHGDGDNPYDDILAAADGFCVTCDSVNMISEACAVGRPVYLLPLAEKSGWRAQRAVRKFSRFHTELVTQNRVRQWDGDWTWFDAPSPLNETMRAAAAVEVLWQNNHPYQACGV